MKKPRTLDEARKGKYGPVRYMENRCAADVWLSGAWRPFQCSRSNGHGPAELYCKQHRKVLFGTE